MGNTLCEVLAAVVVGVGTGLLVTTVMTISGPKKAQAPTPARADPTVNEQCLKLYQHVSANEISEAIELIKKFDTSPGFYICGSCGASGCKIVSLFNPMFGTHETQLKGKLWCGVCKNEEVGILVAGLCPVL